MPCSPPRRRVRVWFGQHAICDYRADAELAQRYAAAMERRFAGLRITNEPLDVQSPAPAPPDLPTNQLLWPLTAL